MGILPKNQLTVWGEVCLRREILFHATQTLGEHLRSHVGIIGAVKQMVGRGDAEQHTDDLRSVCTGQVVIEGCKIRLVVYLTHHLVFLHHGCQRLHALMCVAPGQIGGKADTGEEIHTKGWALLFDTELLRGSELGRRMVDYTFFNYSVSEALLMTDEQRQSIVNLLEQMRQELRREEDTHTLRIVASYISMILELVARYYAIQLSISAKSSNSDLLPRFEHLLRQYYAQNLQRQYGLPTVKYCAQQLFLSPNYFGDLIRELTGGTATSHIRRFLMQRAQQLLISGATITETSEQLGFEYPQHFTRQFKKHFGQTPSEFIKESSHRLPANLVNSDKYPR